MVGPASTVTIAAAVLSPVAGSKSGPETVTELVRLPLEPGRRISVSEAELWLLIVPRGQVTRPAFALQLPCEEVAETKVTPAGSGSLSTAAAAADGPRLVTRIE